MCFFDRQRGVDKEDLPDEMGQVITKCVRPPPAPLKVVQEKKKQLQVTRRKIVTSYKLQVTSYKLQGNSNQYTVNKKQVTIQALTSSATATGSATTTSSATIIPVTCLPTGRFVSIRVIRIKNTFNDSTI